MDDLELSLQVQLAHVPLRWVRYPMPVLDYTVHLPCLAAVDMNKPNNSSLKSPRKK
jgi:hypothetical protein